MVMVVNVSLSFLLNASVVPLIGGHVLSDTIASRIYSSILVFTFIASLAVVLRLITLNNTIQLKKEIAESRYRKAELALLRSQISPHFLFNVFNNIDELIFEDREKASESLSNLSESLRYVLQDSSREFVPVGDELEFVENYLSVASLSFSHKDFISYRKTGNCTGTEIAPMLLIPFIENAVKHCDRKAQPPGIDIVVECKKEKLTLYCRNQKKDIISDLVPGRQGLGLSNVMKRLELIYEHRHQLNITNDHKYYIVELIIYFR
jgi:LytS/YehU family sensor histidine kinase